jgi:hypothetical protein
MHIRTSKVYTYFSIVFFVICHPKNVPWEGAAVSRHWHSRGGQLDQSIGIVEGGKLYQSTQVK